MTNLDDRLRDAAASLEPSDAPIPPFKGVLQRARRRRMIGVTGALVAIAAVTFAAVSTTRDHDRVIVATPRSTSTTLAPSTTTTATTVPSVELSDVTVYLVADDHVVAAGREVEGAQTPESALRALLEQPLPAVERDLGFMTAIPTGTVLHSVTVDGPVATVDLSAQFASGIGVFAEQARVAQVVFTVTQFAGIDHVRFRIDGTPVSTIGGEGVSVDNVDRAAFANITPLILVESPTPGATVGTPLNVRGMSNTFEAGINYTLYDSTGAVLVEGYTTATAGTGTWGTFDFDVAYTVPRAEPGRLSVYEISAKDGSRVHETSVPLDLQP
ncbi:MAG TPA: Gmad2 immunoglobulin-like domain-containing protein [Acidimicrobiia bacterium]|jgi:spore germination protein GerM|nr:Gmad2 immunoglobulin-like domain-containing protein [Acidimicrobiia bacterium]